MDDLEPVAMETTGELLAEIERLKRAHTPAIAILVSRRPWMVFKRDPEAKAHVEFWPGGEETFASVPVVLWKNAGQPRVFSDLGELDGVCFALPRPLVPMRR